MTNKPQTIQLTDCIILECFSVYRVELYCKTQNESRATAWVGFVINQMEKQTDHHQRNMVWYV